MVTMSNQSESVKVVVRCRPMNEREKGMHSKVSWFFLKIFDMNIYPALSFPLLNFSALYIYEYVRELYVEGHASQLCRYRVLGTFHLEFLIMQSLLTFSPKY